jgi:hypothetical protein
MTYRILLFEEIGNRSNVVGHSKLGVYFYGLTEIRNNKRVKA